jgi:hypothetical protein
MKINGNYSILFAVFLFYSLTNTICASAQEDDEKVKINISPQTEECINCHEMYTPGIVQDWLTSRHSKTTPEQALKKPLLQRRISAKKVPDSLSKYAVGCYECHSRNPESHKDNFEHLDFKINVVVTPNDCKTCHPIEVKQYSGSKKAHAYKNLMKNPVYHTLVGSVIGLQKYERGKIFLETPSQMTLNDVCLGCHGTKIEVKGMKKIDTEFGEIEVPNLINWPNQGVGRENPDGSIGSCTPCHARHAFSIEVARKPYTCMQCHAEPDVPAWQVYKVSKHGNIFSSKHQDWNFNSVPWVLGKDFTAPTCATCHNSLIVSPDGEVIAERTHDFGSRLWVRLFGLIYSHPQPKSGNTTIIKNKDGMPLPTTFTNELASEYLIDKKEQEKRLNIMKSVCNGCHNTDWINSHFEKLEKHIKETDEMVLTATKLIEEAWEKGIEDRTNPFDESIEKMWIEQWLFYANTVRYASAMTGAYDYTGFNLGWWELTRNIQNMKDMIDIKYNHILKAKDQR